MQLFNLIITVMATGLLCRLYAASSSDAENLETVIHIHNVEALAKFEHKTISIGNPAESFQVLTFATDNENLKKEIFQTIDQERSEGLTLQEIYQMCRDSTYSHTDASFFAAIFSFKKGRCFTYSDNWTAEIGNGKEIIKIRSYYDEVDEGSPIPNLFIINPATLEISNFYARDAIRTLYKNRSHESLTIINNELQRSLRPTNKPHMIAVQIKSKQLTLALETLTPTSTVSPCRCIML